MKETTNYKFKKPDTNDFFNVDHFNYNTDLVDKELNNLKKEIESKATDAAGTSYDNTNSKLTSTNVQGAIDELNTKANENKTSISSLKTKVDNGQNHKLTNDDGNAIDISNGNANTLTKCGVYVGSNITNCPDNGFWMIESKAQNSNFIIQEATKFTDPKATKKTRSCISGVWCEWRSL